MKKLLSCLTATLLLVTASSTRAAEVFLKVAVSGTVQSQTILGPTNGRIRTAVLNEKRIFQEYGVSAQDYELVFGATSGFQLIPKQASAMLPTLSILTITTTATAIDTKAGVFKFGGPVTPGPASTSIFNNLAGELVGTAHYVGSFPPTAFKKVIFSVTGRGSDPSMGGSGTSLLKFKVVTNGIFVQH